MRFSTIVVAFLISFAATLASPTSTAGQPSSHLLRDESQFIEQCSGIELPYLYESQRQDEAILSCMLDHVMDEPALGFAYHEPCWPLGYNNTRTETVCQDSLATTAYEACTTLSSTLKEDAIFMKMSFSMSMSMSMDFGSNDHPEDDEMRLRERFCSILDDLTTETGLECLEMICDTQSYMPSSSPTPESAVPSSVPSALPSLAPSSSPSASPSAMPSSTPSSFPTLEDIQHVVQVELLSEFVVDIRTLSELEFLDEAARESIVETLSSFAAGTRVTILTVNGSTLRRLQKAVPIGFTVEATKECYVQDCDKFAADFIATISSALLNSVINGTMQMLIRQEAVDQGVDSLTTANVIANSYQLLQSYYQLNDPVVVSNPEGVRSSSSTVATLTGLVVVTVGTLLAL